MEFVLNHNFPPKSAKTNAHKANLFSNAKTNDYSAETNNFSKLKKNLALHQQNNATDIREIQNVAESISNTNIALKVFNKKKNVSHNPPSDGYTNLIQSARNLRSQNEDKKVLAQFLCDKSKHLVDYLNKDGKIVDSKEIRISNLSSNIFHIQDVFNNK